MSLTILVAPSGFKESLDAPEVAAAIADGIGRVLPRARVVTAPVADGGEGFSRALVGATGGTLHPAVVTGPTGAPVAAHFGVLGGPGPRTAVVEMAAAAGLRLVPAGERDPLRTTTYGVGQLLLAALDAGVERILVGCGDSGTNDGGLGLAAALGHRFLDRHGRELLPVGASLEHVAAVDRSQVDPRLARTAVEVACNPDNLLLGPRGVARTYGPQKGATPADIARLEAGLVRYARVIHTATGIEVDAIRGAGASGGLGAGLAAWCGASLLPRWDVVSRYLDLEGLLDDADLVVTAEGCLDRQTPNGKIPAEIARRARHRRIPVVALAGTIGAGATAVLGTGIGAFQGILQRPCTLAEAMEDTSRLLADAAEQAMRFVVIGADLAGDRVLAA